MAQFLSQLVTLDDGNGRTEKLVGHLAYRSDVLGCDIYVPAGFETDFASIPRGVWNIIPKNGKHDRAAVLHDWLYVSGTDGERTITRKRADDVFAEALKVCEVKAWQRQAIYWAVRFGGGKAWNGYRATASA